MGGSMIDLTELNPKEKTRTYTFPNGEKVVLNERNALHGSGQRHAPAQTVGRQAAHRAEVGWLHIEIDAEKFTL
jgi:hypothetical protein